MPDFDWKLLAPHEPLGHKSRFYVPRPEEGAARLAALINGGANPIGVVGPVGSGKSTEMARTERELLGRKALFCMIDHVTTDKFHHVRITAELILGISILRCARGFWEEFSPELREKLTRGGFPPAGPSNQASKRKPKQWEDLLREIGREIRNSSGAQLVLLIDGLEKCDGDEARKIVDLLMRCRTELVLVMVLPTELVNGPASYDIVSSFKLFPLRPVSVKEEPDARWQEGRMFLKNIVLLRLGLTPPLPAGLDEVLDRAAEASGGIPRAFLQLVMDAALYANLANRKLPTLEDLREAMGDHVESLRRLLNKGDIAALRAADGTDGLEVEPERRLRFLAHGLLLEYKLANRIIVHPAPLLGSILATGERP